MSLLDHPIFVPSGEASRSFRHALSLTATLALVVLAILLPVMQSSDEAAQGYRIRALQQQKSDLEAQIYLAQSDIAQLGSLARIDNEARNRLGMVPLNRETSVSVTVPLPEVRSIPNGFLPPAQPPAPATHESLWKKIAHLLPFS